MAAAKKAIIIWKPLCLNYCWSSLLLVDTVPIVTLLVSPLREVGVRQAPGEMKRGSNSHLY